MLTEIILSGAAVGALYKCYALEGKLFKVERRLQALETAEQASLPVPVRVAEAASTIPPAATSALPAAAPLVNLSKGVVAKVTAAASSPHNMLQPVPESSPVTRPTSRPEKLAAEPGALHNATSTLLSLVRANPFASAGVLLVLVGMGFLFSLLAASNILPPALRVVMVALAGVAAFAYGTKQEKTHPTFAMNLQGGAIALEFLCALWAYQGYNLIGSTTAFVWMAGLSAAAVGWAAYRKQGLFAFMGIAGSLLTPIIASTGSGTFSGLLAYSVWVSVLGLGISRFLGMPTLMGTTLAGVAALLGAALGLPKGSETVSQGATLALLVGYASLALSWTSTKYIWAARQQASIVGVLISAPLLAVGLLSTMAGVSAGVNSIILGLVTVVFLARLRNAGESWQAWLVPISGGLGLVALAIGLDGGTRAIAFSAGAMGFVLIARTKSKRWLDTIAFLYWLLSVALAIDAGGYGESTGLIVSGLVALGAGFLMRRTAVGLLYTTLAPLILWHALCSDFLLSSPITPLWFSAWAVGALFLGRRLAWNELRLSAIWVLICAVPFLFFGAMGSGPYLVVREVTFALWLAVSAVTVKLLDDDSGLPNLRPSPLNVERASLVIPTLLYFEAWRLMGKLGTPPELLAEALTAAVWCAWCFITALPAVKFNFHPRIAGLVGGILLLLNALGSPLSLGSEIVQWLSLAVLCYTAQTRALRGKQTNITATMALAGVMVIATVLRAIGLSYGLSESAVSLLFARPMQPWVSLLWAAACIATVVWGAKMRSRRLWLGGGAAIGVLLLKMLLVDLATFSLAAKVGVFIVTGLAFIALGRYSPVSPGAEPKTSA